MTRYQYNSKGQIIRIEDAKGGNKHVGYHVTGDVAWFRDCSGKMTKWDYDFLGRLIKLTEASGTTEEYSYDRYGELAKVARSGVNPIYWSTMPRVVYLSLSMVWIGRRLIDIIQQVECRRVLMP